MKAKKKKIFFIYGYGDNPESETFKNFKSSINPKRYEVISDYYAQYSPKEALIDLNNYIRENKIDIVIGIELGGWLATLLENRKIKKILIDPTFNPLIEFKNERKFPDYMAKFYQEYIDKLTIDDYNYLNTHILYTEKLINEFTEIDVKNIIYVDDSYKELSNITKKFILPLL